MRAVLCLRQGRHPGFLPSPLCLQLFIPPRVMLAPFERPVHPTRVITFWKEPLCHVDARSHASSTPTWPATPRLSAPSLAVFTRAAGPARWASRRDDPADVQTVSTAHRGQGGGASVGRRAARPRPLLLVAPCGPERRPAALRPHPPPF